MRLIQKKAKKADGDNMFIKLIVYICITLSSLLHAKKDFYYNYVDNNNEQISNKISSQANYGAILLDEVQKDIDNNKILDARAKIIDFRANNKIKALIPRGAYLYALIAYKQKDPYAIGESIKQLNSLISRSLIKNKELLKVMYLLSQLNMFANNEQQAIYWAKNIFRTFDSAQAHIKGYKAISKIYYKQKKHKYAIKILKKAITKLKDDNNSVILLYEIYLHLMAVDRVKDATKVAKNIISNYLEYYKDDITKIQDIVDSLSKNGNKQEAVEFLQSLLNEDIPKEQIDYIRFELANTYMAINTKDDAFRLKAKKLYEQIMIGAKKNRFYKMSKLRRDEVLMREDKLSTKEFYKRYIAYEFHRQKALVQELILALRQNNYDLLLKKQYMELDDRIFENYGYKSKEAFYNLVHHDMVMYAIENKQCSKLSTYTTIINQQLLTKIIHNKQYTSTYINCILQAPSVKTYLALKKTLKNSKDANLMFFLEQLAIKLGKYNDAYAFSKKVQASKNATVSAKELLYGLEILIHLDDVNKYNAFFKYVINYPEYEESNQHDARIVDYYYYYYHYLMRKHQDEEAFFVLQNLNQAQNDHDVYIYSPFVELSLASNFYLNYGYNNTLQVINDGFEHADKIEDEDLMQMYYYKAKAYSGLENKQKAKRYAIKCLKVRVKSIYKNLCKAMIKLK